MFWEVVTLYEKMTRVRSQGRVHCMGLGETSTLNLYSIICFYDNVIMIKLTTPKHIDVNNHFVGINVPSKDQLMIFNTSST